MARATTPKSPRERTAREAMITEAPPPATAPPRVTALALDPAPLTPAMAAYFAKCEEKIGFVPNVLVAYAHDATKLALFVALYDDLMLGPSGLSKLEREMIAVVVSAQSRCYYCLVAHGAAVRRLSKRPELGEQLVMNDRAARVSPRERALLDFAREVAVAAHAIAEPNREALRAAGLSDKDIWDAAAVAAFFAMSNRLASATDMRPNDEYHASYR